MDSGANSEVNSPASLGVNGGQGSPSIGSPNTIGSPQPQHTAMDMNKSYDEDDSQSPINCIVTPVSSSHGGDTPSPPIMPLSLAASVSSKSHFTTLAGAGGIPSMVPNIYKTLDPLHHRPSVYSSPPPSIGGGSGGSAGDLSANECKLIDYRGAKIAAFIVNGETLLCLPQAFELFLKHLVGGLHTVYTKLKRLEVTPIVCNVEQVRILRGLGAIQPGVNRCKLLSCKDFDLLYKDCTTARSVPIF
ncbi:Dachshund 1 [Nymphon striatum]|nr:Dachshund 1 [Nymphon striatum]